MSDKKPVFTIGKIRVKSIKFKKTRAHEEAAAKFSEPYVPEKHNPTSALRPGAMDAYTKPSRIGDKLIAYKPPISGCH